KYSWSHPRSRGGWWRHAADLTCAYPDDALDTARETFIALCDRIGSPRCDWRVLERKVRAFDAIETREEKKDWFLSNVPQLRNLDFVDRLSLPRRRYGGSPHALCPRAEMGGSNKVPKCATEGGYDLRSATAGNAPAAAADTGPDGVPFAGGCEDD